MALGTLALLAATSARADWTQSTFQISGYAWVANPDTTMLVRIHNAGLDWVYAWHTSVGATLPVAATLNSRLDGLRTSHAGFKLQAMAVYADPTTIHARLLYNRDVPVLIDSVATALNPSNGINSVSTAGWAIWDEPCSDTSFTNLGAISRLVDSTQTRLGYTNLLPMYSYNFGNPVGCYSMRFGSGGGYTKESGYSKYLDTYLSQFNSRPHPAPLLSIDHYTFQVPNSPTQDYFWNLRLLRNKAAEYSRPNQRIPVCMIVELSPYHANLPGATFPANFTFTNTRWQIYSALAYGVKNITYWLLTPAQFDTSSGQEVWGDGIFGATGDTASNGAYSKVRALNKELHNLGPTLMRLDPVTCFHVDSLGSNGIADELFTSPKKVYNIVSSIAGGGLGMPADSCLIGYLKDRTNGDDYLMVVNKALIAAQTYTIGLTNTADSLYRVDRSTGNQVLVGTNQTSITVTSMPPGQGELFRIVDKTFEYIPNVNSIAIAGDTTYYAHDRGVVMTVGKTGRRVHYNDGTTYTPAVDVAISNNRIYVAQDNGTNGNVVRLRRDLSNPTAFYTGHPRVRGVSAQEAESCVVIVDRLTATTSNVVVVDTAGTVLKTLAFNDAGAPSTPYIAYDVQYQEGLGSFVVAHGRYYSRYLAKSPWTLLQSAHYRVPAPTSVRLTALNRGTAQLLFAGRNEGTIGGVEKMDYKLVKPGTNGWWPAGGTEPSVKDVSAAGNHVMFASTSPGGDFFVRLRALDLWALGYRSTTAPKSVGLTADSIALMANGPGAARSSQSALTGNFLVFVPPPMESVIGDSLQAAPTLVLSLGARPNPGIGSTVVRFTLPRSTHVELGVFDVQGRRVRSLVNAQVAAGIHELEWAPPQKGVYFLRLRVGGAGGETRTEKLVMR